MQHGLAKRIRLILEPGFPDTNPTRNWSKYERRGKREDVPRKRTTSAALKHDRDARRERVNVHIFLVLLFDLTVFIRLVRVGQANSNAACTLRPSANRAGRSRARRKSQYRAALRSIFAKALLAILSSQSRRPMSSAALREPKMSTSPRTH